MAKINDIKYFKQVQGEELQLLQGTHMELLRNMKKLKILINHPKRLREKS